MAALGILRGKRPTQPAHEKAITHHIKILLTIQDFITYRMSSDMEKRMMRVTKAIAFVGLFLIFAHSRASAQEANVASTLVQLAPIISSAIDGVFALLIAVLGLLIRNNVKDQRMATLLASAVQNSLGVVQQAAKSSVGDAALDVKDPGVAAAIQKGVDYINQHAAEARTFFKIDDAHLVSKIEAKLGLAAIATNLAETSSSTPVVAGPLAPAPAGIK